MFQFSPKVFSSFVSTIWSEASSKQKTASPSYFYFKPIKGKAGAARNDILFF